MLKKNQIQVNMSEFSICAQKKKNVGGRGVEAQLQRRHHTVQQFSNNPLQCPPPFRRLPFSLSLSLPPCPSSITSFSHALLPPDFSFGAAAGPHTMATFICGSLLHAFIFSFTSFFILSQKRAHIHLADKRFTSDLSQLISVSFPPSAMLTTSEPFGVLSSKMCH